MYSAFHIAQISMIIHLNINLHCMKRALAEDPHEELSFLSRVKGGWQDNIVARI